ncbi:hypothetical protein [Streptomyces cavernae]|uniref:hypothetical protein n=1 Tax=Streptomyces cavernae TaxID=2259034 RepID=UPI000FEB8A4B|nr:hypothetical protein [Streptomyces cavernae]
MDGRLRDRLRTFYEFCLDVFDDLRHDGVPAREVLVLVGAVAQWLCAVAGLVYFWPRGVTLSTYAVVQAACVGCQALAVAGVVWPGRRAGSRDLAGLQQGLTLNVLLCTWLLGVLPVGGFLMLTSLEPDGSPAGLGTPVEAVFWSGTALMLGSIAGLISVVVLADRVRRSDAGEGSADGPSMGASPSEDDGHGSGSWSGDD